MGGKEGEKQNKQDLSTHTSQASLISLEYPIFSPKATVRFPPHSLQATAENRDFRLLISMKHRSLSLSVSSASPTYFLIKSSFLLAVHWSSCSSGSGTLSWPAWRSAELELAEVVASPWADSTCSDTFSTCNSDSCWSALLHCQRVWAAS